MKPTVFLLTALLLLSACAQTSEVSKTSEVSPTPRPTETPTPTPEPTPTPIEVSDLLDEETHQLLVQYGFHFGHPKDSKIPLYQTVRGAGSKNIGWLDEKGLHFATTVFALGANEDGSVYDATFTTPAEKNAFLVDQKSKDQAALTIVETKNPLFKNGILTLTQKETGADGEEQEVVYIFDDKRAEFVRKVEMGKDIESPSYYAWDYEEVVIASAILDGLDQPFPDKTVKAFKGGWAMNFEYDEKTDSSVAYLVPYGTEYSLMLRWALDENSKPVWFTTIAPDGTTYESILTQIFSPQNMEKPQADETMLILATAGEWWNEPVRSEFIRDYVNRPDKAYPPFWEELLPRLFLASKNGKNGRWFDNRALADWYGPRPSLDALFKQKGNDSGKIVYRDTDQNTFGDIYSQGLAEVPEAPQKIEAIGIKKWVNGEGIWLPIPAEFQSYLFALSFVGK